MVVFLQHIASGLKNVIHLKNGVLIIAKIINIFFESDENTSEAFVVKASR
jgi:hypothetical protein